MIPAIKTARPKTKITAFKYSMSICDLLYLVFPNSNLKNTDIFNYPFSIFNNYDSLCLERAANAHEGHRWPPLRGSAFDELPIAADVHVLKNDVGRLRQTQQLLFAGLHVLEGDFALGDFILA